MGASKQQKRAAGAPAPAPTSEAAGHDEAPASKAAKTSEKAEAGKFRMPDAAEVLEISQTQNLYKSNLFRLQLEEMMKEMAPRSSQKHVDAFLKSLKGVVDKLASRQIPEDFAKEFPKLHFQQLQPFPFAFGPPKRMDIAGSYMLGTSTSSVPTVDIALEMPGDAFQSKDFLNFRYANKRSVYVGELHRQLSALAGSAKGPLRGADVKVEPLHGDACRPCVSLRFKTGEAGESPFMVRLLPVYPAGLFAPSKLTPDRNTVRSIAAAGSTADAVLPTALYNNCVLEDGRMRAHLDILHQLTQKIPAFRDAVLLLKRWATAKNLLASASDRAVSTTLSGFLLSMLAAHTAQSSGLAPLQTSSFQLFKLTLSTVSSTDWATQKLLFGQAAAAPLTEQEKAAGGAHFYDTDGAFNFMWRLGPFIADVKDEAKRALKVLDAESDPFDAVFGLQTASPALHWDLAIRTAPLGVAAMCPAGKAPEAPTAATAAGVGGQVAPDSPEALAIAARLTSVLIEGLGDRCLRAVPRLASDAGSTSVVIGLQLEAVNQDRGLDRGPSAETEAAGRWRALWGQEKSELRRFKDGSVLECVAWTKPPADRISESKKQPAVVTQIVRHLLQKHFPQVAEGAELVAGPVGFVTNLGDRERRLWTAFDGMKAQLCQLSSLPLAIKDVHAVDRSFSYTALKASPAPPTADGVARTLHHAVVEFESSGRWPDDATAAQKVAAAMLLQMKEELMSDLGIEADINEAFLDVKTPEFVFRVQIFHQHEFREIAQSVTAFQAPSNTSEEPGEAILERLRNLWWRPRVRAALKSHVLQRPALAGAVRLCQRWMASQLMSGYEEFVEHLVAATFTSPAPFEAPTSPQAAFARFCWLLSCFDWEHEPLIVDFDGKLSGEERLQLRQSFERNLDDSKSSAAFWITSRFDPHAVLLPCPPATVATWLKRRAQYALGVCHKKVIGNGGKALGWDSLFALDTSLFDVTVRLKPAEQGAAREDGATKKKGAKAAQERASATPEAVRSFINKLRENFSAVALVFHDADCKVVALKWRPTAFLPQASSILMGAVPHTMVEQGEGQAPLCVPNVLYLTSAIASLAEGLATDISVTAARG